MQLFLNVFWLDGCLRGVVEEFEVGRWENSEENRQKTGRMFIISLNFRMILVASLEQPDW
jgi:hypothetical protein